MIDKNAVVHSNSVLSRFVCMVRFEKVYSSYNRSQSFNKTEAEVFWVLFFTYKGKKC